MAYSFQNLKISCYEINKIEACEVTAQMGEHSQLSLKAILKEETKDDPVHQTGDVQEVEVYVEEENGKKISLFHGVVTKVKVIFKAEVYWLELEAKSSTYLMDITKHCRSFQDLNMGYHEVIKSIMQDYPHSDCIIKIPNEPIGELLVQYEETDWAFIKRIASSFNAPLFPAVEVPGIRFFVGAEDIPIENFNIKRIDARKNLDSYYRIKANTMQPISETWYTFYDIQAEEIAYLMHHIEINGHKFYIQSLSSKLEDSLLVNHYAFQVKSGLKAQEIFPMELVGVAIGGKILVPEADKVKIHLDIDEKQDVGTAYWFPYSTMSASNDGSGWYCMPEVGDTVRVYFPTKYTKDAVALSSVSIYDAPSSAPDRMSNPDVKYLGTVHDKEMKLAPEGIRLACNGSVAVLNISDTGSISLYGNNSVNITAQEKLDVKVKTDLQLTAIKSIELACDKGGKVLLDEAGNMIIQGTEVKID